ncbi:MAG TPA: hypothetical protein VFY05_02135, partial [Candidatus Angelobacter sp.]|nr:hypothetical protein [Candidatus Angelobacter sp.]
LAFLHRGCMVGIECGRSHARFRVVWVGRGQIGVRSAEPGKYIWGVPLKRNMEEVPAGMEASASV